MIPLWFPMHNKSGTTSAQDAALPPPTPPAEPMTRSNMTNFPNIRALALRVRGLRTSLISKSRFRSRRASGTIKPAPMHLRPRRTHTSARRPLTQAWKRCTRTIHRESLPCLFSIVEPPTPNEGSLPADSLLASRAHHLRRASISSASVWSDWTVISADF
ncbi:unnamed protein product [Peniophora sp. CBMAI 1063]|nr:unnamed protein product [Peniophora sp. CBMAI 1063]